MLYLQPDADLTAVDYRKLFRDAGASRNHVSTLMRAGFWLFVG